MAVDILWGIPVLLFVEFAPIAVVRKRSPRTIGITAAAAYLFIVAAALTLALVSTDEFGFRFIPFAVLAAPWYMLMPSGTVMPEGLALPLLSVVLNCALIFLFTRFIVSRARARKVLTDKTVELQTPRSGPRS